MDAAIGHGTFDVRILVNGAQQRQTEYNHTINAQQVRQILIVITLNMVDAIRKRKAP
ncbi:MAG: hypothetical protein ACJA1Z_003036 [Patiriisocius sp.]|jgi:hypothetical protein